MQKLRYIRTSLVALELISSQKITTTTTTRNTHTNMTFRGREVAKVATAIEQAEGVGARVRRGIGSFGVRNFTPFLMLDHFKIGKGAGFPDHPHRGQETITYMLKGNVDHEDFTGSSGTIGPGDLQFMTAGKGIMHAEMPRAGADGAEPEGMQLWVDLPEKLKSCEPRYRDLLANEIPVAQPNDKVSVKVISGRAFGVESAKDLAYTPVWYLHYTLQPGATVQQELPEGFNSFLYVLKGLVHTGTTNKKAVNQYQIAFFEQDGTGVDLSVPEDAKEPTELILVAGQVLDQAIVQHGPFVETSRPKIMKAIMDFSSATNGFERALGWKSKIGGR